MKKKINISIEARMTSSRLPGKVLKKVLGKPILELMIERVKRSFYYDELIIATTTNKDDDPIIELCNNLNVKYYRGSEPDVLKRVYSAHKEFGSDIVVELTGDCPIIDPKLIDLSILNYLHNDYDYVSTSQEKTYPVGQDIQVFSFELLEFLNNNALTQSDREHVTPHIYNNPDTFKIFNVPAKKSQFHPEVWVTLDTQEDFNLIKKIFEELYPKNNTFDLDDILNFYFQNK